jgi:ribosomal protein L29
MKAFEEHREEELAELRASVATREKEAAQLRARLEAQKLEAQGETHHV